MGSSQNYILYIVFSYFYMHIFRVLLSISHPTIQDACRELVCLLATIARDFDVGRAGYLQLEALRARYSISLLPTHDKGPVAMLCKI